MENEPTAETLRVYRKNIGKDYYAIEHKGIQLVNGETTSKNFDKRPMGFRFWNVNGEKGLRHRFVEVKGFR